MTYFFHILDEYDTNQIQIAGEKMSPKFKLALSMLGWQTSTTILFVIFYYVLNRIFGILNSELQLMVYWGAYSGFTLYHAALYGIFFVAITRSEEGV